MKYFTEEPHGNFTEYCLGEAEGSAATRGFAQTVRGKIAMGLGNLVLHDPVGEKWERKQKSGKHPTFSGELR